MVEIVIVAIVLAVLFYSLWRAHVAKAAPDDVDAREAAINIWQSRLAALQARDDLDESERERELDRLRAGVLADAGEQVAPSVLGPRTLGFVLSFALLSITAWVGYTQTGGLKQVSLTQDTQAVTAALDAAQSLEEAISVMQDAVERHPLPERFFSLAQLLEQSGDLTSAYQAFRSARERAELDATYADALATFLANEAQVWLASDAEALEPARALGLRALELEPNNPTALGMLGVAAFEQSDFAGAERYWGKLLDQLTPGTPDFQAVAEGLTLAREAQGISEARVMVRIEKPNSVLAPETPVFVYARQSEQAPMPLVVSRVTVGELPIQIELTNEMKMGPMAGLDGLDRVEVVARVSLSGGVAPAPGDIEGIASDVSTQNGLARIVLDRQL